MRLKKFKAHIDPVNVNDPLDKWLKDLVSEVPAPKEVSCGGKYYGKSMPQRCAHGHHVYLNKLFQVNGKNHAVLLFVSEAKHIELHRIMALGLARGNLSAYEKAVKKECPYIKDRIAKIYKRRIKSLKEEKTSRLLGVLEYFKHKFS